MSEDLKKQITGFINHCRTCTVATVSSEGGPNASTVYFKNNGLDLYFNTSKESQKVEDLKHNAKVAITIEGDGPIPESDKDIKGIQYYGKAEVLADDDTSGVPQTVIARHKAFNSVRPGNSVIVKVAPNKIHFLDYSRGFRHRDTLEL
ncbi:MAG: pyridoxamine 5'-phosphate oxidase family protein [Chloroflexota bacterium]|nr:pyridoxamine 5'-phosphate oxidase family protein [Chloroflexota bacterium]